MLKNKYVMQTKLTLRVEDSVIRKAKRLAQKRGSSVSKIFSDFITEEKDDQELADLGEITASMIGALGGVNIPDDKDDYHAHLEAKYL